MIGLSDGLYIRQPDGTWKKIATHAVVKPVFKKTAPPQGFFAVVPLTVSVPFTITKWPRRGSYEWLIRQYFSMN